MSRVPRKKDEGEKAKGEGTLCGLLILLLFIILCRVLYFSSVISLSACCRFLFEGVSEKIKRKMKSKGMLYVLPMRCLSVLILVSFVTFFSVILLLACYSFGFRGVFRKKRKRKKVKSEGTPFGLLIPLIFVICYLEKGGKGAVWMKEGLEKGGGRKEP